MAFDIGTSHLKWVVVEADSGQRLWDGRANIAADNRGPASEQDPKDVLRAVDQALNDASSYGSIGRVAFSAAMHTFMAVDAHGAPLTKSWTWMDRRGASTAHELRESGIGFRLQEATGVPVHAMSPLVKWLTVKDTLPSGARPAALKDYVVHHLTGQWLTDYSTASASGFLGLDNQWLDQALDLAGLTAGELPGLQTLTDRVAAQHGDWDVVLGANDGAAAHRHLHIPKDGTVAVLAMGTSGALRTTMPGPAVHPELFCYTMGPNQGYLLGSAFSNVGNVLEWLARLFSVDIDTIVNEGLAAARSDRPLPLSLAFWFGERSPWWREDLQGAWLGMIPNHGRSELSGSVLLSMAAAYSHGLVGLRNAGAPIREIRGGSGLLDVPAVTQWMADALGEDIVLHDERDASLLGAIDLARDSRTDSRRTQGARYRPRDTGIRERVQETWNRIQDVVASHS